MHKDLEKYVAPEGERVETGVIALDLILGGGYEKGDMIELSSLSGIGKSTLMLYVIRNLLAKGLRVAYLDIERGVKKGLKESLGLMEFGEDKFVVLNPMTYDEVEEIFDKVLNPAKKDLFCDLVVIDSITAVLPAKFIKNSITDIEPGLESRLMASLLKKYKPVLRETGATLFLINQMRTKIDFNRGSSEDSAGGFALKFYPDIRVRLEGGQAMKRLENTLQGEKEVVYGNMARGYCIKNRGERPMIPVVMPIVYGRGVSNIITLQTILQDLGIITGGQGGFFKVVYGSVSETVRGQALLQAFIKEKKDDMVQYLKSNGLLILTRGEK